MRTSLKNALAAATAKQVPIPSGTAAYVALVLAERLASRPARVTSGSVLLSDEGDVAIVRSEETGAASSEDGLRRVLGAMLGASVAVPETLAALASGPGDLDSLRRGLEGLSAPLNRPLARRILDRWLKDALRGLPPSQILVETDAPPHGEPSAMDAILEDLSVPFIVLSDLEKAEEARRRPSSSLPSIPEARPRRSHTVLYATITLLVVALAGAIWLVRPDLLDRFAGTTPAADAGPGSAAPAAVVRGTLTLTTDPPDAEVLLLVGRGPVEIPHFPVGPGEILVRDDEGRLARAAIDAEATEVAVQVQGEPPRPQAPLPATLASGDPAPAEGEGRTVRVVTNPAGARVYLRVGRVLPGLDVAATQELLVAKAGHAVERVVVTPSDWRAGADGSHTAAVSVRLEPLARKRGR